MNSDIIDRIPGIDELLETAGRHRLVLLGECSHDMHELAAIRARIVRRLVEEQGFSLVMLEAGVASCAETLLGDVDHPADRLGGLYPFYRNEPMLALIRWWDRSDRTSRPAIVGMDSRVLGRGGAWLRSTLEALGYGDAAELEATERSLYEIWRHQLLTGGEEDDARGLESARQVLTRALAWLGDVGAVPIDVEATAASAQRGDATARLDLAAAVLERVLRDRLSLLDVVGDEKRYYEWRERTMAANIDWWCTRVYPGRRAIVWAHNYHAMRRRSAIDGEVNMGESIDPALAADSLIIGSYAAGGVGTYPNRKPFPIAPAPEGSLEHHGIERDDLARVTLFERGEGERWWSSPRLTRSFGLEDETLVPDEQYDGVLVVREASQHRYVDLELARRMPV